MKMALKRNRKSAAWMGITVIMVTLACNIPGLSQNSSPGAETQPENPTQETEMQVEIPTLEATAQPMSPTQSSTSVDNNQANCLAGVIPGQTNRDEVITILGEPDATRQEGNYEALQYPTHLIGQYHTVYLQNQVVEWVSTVLTEDNPLTWSAVRAQYGEPAHTAYSDYLEGSRNLAFPEQGLNFIADPELDIVFVQECFVPMSLADYMQAYGDFLPQENPFTK
jgi:hypothetical protein